MKTNKPWAVIDNESATNPGDRLKVLGRFASEREAAEWIGRQEPAKVKRGGFGLDGPTDES